MNNIKIICTIGPASSSKEMIKKLAQAGMNIARLNFSHGTHESHKTVIDTIKAVREELGVNIGILQDLCGPKMRVKELPEGKIQLKAGETLRITNEGSFSVQNGIPQIVISYKHLLTDVKPGKRILMDDGQLEVVADKVEETAVLCTITHGGTLKSNKGVNFPGLELSQEVPTKKDLTDLEFGIKEGVDFVALSFVQKKEELLVLKKRIKELGGSAKVVAKLERDTAMNNLDPLIEATDIVMVARGDLGIEAEMSMIPIYQKLIVRKSNIMGKPVITATQMLDSMINNPIPTRAEVTDVANAIYDGSDAIMLSGETAAGKYPEDAVKIMRRTANNVEKNLWLDRGWVREEYEDTHFDTEISIAHSICKSAKELKAKYIIANTVSGETARRIAMFRPRTPIVAITPSLDTYFQLAIVWGIKAFYTPVKGQDFLTIIENSGKLLKEKGLVAKDDLVIISSGTPDAPGGTNLMKVHQIQ